MNTYTQIKKWLNKTGGKYVIVEKGKPKYILMKVDEYEKLIAKENPQEENIEAVNKDIAELRQKEAVEIEDIPI